MNVILNQGLDFLKQNNFEAAAKLWFSGSFNSRLSQNEIKEIYKLMNKKYLAVYSLQKWMPMILPI
jgi:hypothetical protein